MKYTVGNILEAQTEALVNTVNTTGVMGKGIALLFKKAFPENFKQYEKAAKNGSLAVGTMLVTHSDQLSPKYIINFPTKIHWRQPSKMEYIEKGLQSLVAVIKENNIQSIAIPPLGSGNGHLKWSEVKILIEKYLSPLSSSVDIIVYEPGYNDQTVVVKKAVELTPARAMLIYLLNRYRILGYSITMLVAQKMAYFLQTNGEMLNLNFEKGIYGPYSHQLLHLLQHLNGTFIQFRHEDNKPATIITMKEEKLSMVEAYVKGTLTQEQRERIEKVLLLIEGFESPYGIELLATVDFIMKNFPDYTIEQIQSEIHNWTTRKKQLMKPHHIEIAYKRLIH